MTVVEFGTGDIKVINTFEPINGMVLAQDAPKPMSEWKLGEGFDYTGEPVPVEANEGEVIYFTFGKVQSVQVLIEVLEEVKRRMLEASKPKNFHDFSENPY